MIEITLRLFGPFGSFGEQVTLLLPEGAVVSDVREVLLKKLKALDGTFKRGKVLIAYSRFASETEILPETTPIQTGDVITIIPPVSGG